MENNKLPTITDQNAKEFHNAIHDYEIVDGDPLTIGHVLKDFPKNTFTHGRIYDAEYVSVGVRAGTGTTIDITQKVHETALPRATENNFNGINSQLNMSRCDGEVLTWAYANHYIPAQFDSGLTYEEDLKEGFNKPYTMNALVPLKEGQEPMWSSAFANYQIKGKPARYVVEPIYAVDPDVVQDL